MFPKMHTLLTHAVDDLVRKGPLKHSNTILGEARHPVFKRDFKRTDGRDAEHQVSTLPSWCKYLGILSLYLDCQAFDNP